MAAQQNIDLGTESIGKLIVRLSIPAIVAQVINALYNIVDRIYIGHMEGSGPLALTGLGVCFPVIMVISAFASLVGMGGAPLASIRMGEGNNPAAKKILGNCSMMLLCFALVLTAFFQVVKEPMLLLFGASQDTIGYATDYLGIYLWGTLFVQASLGLNSFINAQGFAKTGMFTVLIGAVCNIVLDPILIFGFHMGVKGAALATIISQAVSACWVLRFLTGKRAVLTIDKENLRLDRKICGRVLSLGLAPFTMQSTESLVNIVLNSSLQRYGGDPAVGAMTIISSMMQFMMLPLSGLGQGAQPIMSYNYGARKPERVKKAFRTFLALAVAFSTAAWIAVMCFPSFFVRLFSQDESLMQITVWAIRIYFAASFMMGIQMACQQTFLAMGQAKTSLFLALLRKVLLLIPLALILPRVGLGLTGVFLAEPIADAAAASTTLIMFLWQSKKLLSLPETVPQSES